MEDPNKCLKLVYWPKEGDHYVITTGIFGRTARLTTVDVVTAVDDDGDEVFVAWDIRFDDMETPARFTPALWHSTAANWVLVGWQGIDRIWEPAIYRLAPSATA